MEVRLGCRFCDGCRGDVRRCRWKGAKSAGMDAAKRPGMAISRYSRARTDVETLFVDQCSICTDGREGLFIGAPWLKWCSTICDDRTADRRKPAPERHRSHLHRMLLQHLPRIAEFRKNRLHRLPEPRAMIHL